MLLAIVAAAATLSMPYTTQVVDTDAPCIKNEAGACRTQYKTVTYEISFTLIKSTAAGHYYRLTDQPKLTVDTKACDAFAAQLTRQGMSVPRFTYLRVADVNDIVRYTGSVAYGVALGSTIWSSEACQPHELVHTATLGIGHPGSFWTEGIAVALDTGDHGAYRIGEARRSAQRLGIDGVANLIRLFGPWTAPPASDAARTQRYAIAGAFTEHLIETHGLTNLRVFFREYRDPALPESCAWGCHDVLRFEAMDKAFRAVYGQSIRTALDGWLTDPSRK